MSRTANYGIGASACTGAPEFALALILCAGTDGPHRLAAPRLPSAPNALILRTQIAGTRTALVDLPQLLIFRRNQCLNNPSPANRARPVKATWKHARAAGMQLKRTAILDAAARTIMCSGADAVSVS